MQRRKLFFELWPSFHTLYQMYRKALKYLDDTWIYPHKEDGLRYGSTTLLTLVMPLLHVVKALTAG